MRLRFLTTLLIVLAVQAVAPGGPPLRTDDPDTPNRGIWEINLSHNLERTTDHVLQTVPLFDINYSITDNDQWNVVFGVLSLDEEDAPQHWGISDMLLAWKHRFFNDDDHGFSLAVNPQLHVPTGNANLGLGDGLTGVFLPILLGKHMADDKLFVYGELRYNWLFSAAESSNWVWGVAAEWQATKKFCVLGEIGGVVYPGGAPTDTAQLVFADETFPPDDVFCNLGFKYALSKNTNFMGAFGRSLRSSGTHGTIDFMSYVGVQMFLGGSDKDKGDEDKKDKDGKPRKKHHYWR